MYIMYIVNSREMLFGQQKLESNSGPTLKAAIWNIPALNNAKIGGATFINPLYVMTTNLPRTFIR